MYALLFDTETTGFYAKDEVIQFCGILVEIISTNGSCSIKLRELYNFYCDTQKSINPDARRVHGIDKELLKKLSEGRTFEDNFYPMIKNIEHLNPIWIAYNASFDKRLINQTLTNNGLPAYDFGKTLPLLRDGDRTRNMCLMNAMTSIDKRGRRRKLMEVVNEIHSPEVLEKSFRVFANHCKMDSDISFHNAVYDTYCLYLILERYIMRLVG